MLLHNDYYVSSLNLSSQIQFAWTPPNVTYRHFVHISTTTARNYEKQATYHLAPFINPKVAHFFSCVHFP